MIVIAIILVVSLISELNKMYCARLFDDGNVITFGKKGKGKDVIHMIMINYRKKAYRSNIVYRPGDIPRPVGYYTVAPNTYEQFIEGKVQVIPQQIEPNHDYYISDGGIILPSQYDSLLSRLYPSLPIFYALSRQLGNINIHINTQALGRVWIKLREQADAYVMARGTIHLLGFSIVFLRYYENYDTAEKGMKPYRSQIMNKQAKAEQEMFNAQYGLIKNMFMITRTKKLTYDTYHYHKVIYGVSFAPKLKAIATSTLPKNRSMANHGHD